eukprot:TRINITY_DN14929_c0_g1_i1.p1 TRINITY_DN14929_c0_g1~~TRINITY_DN14929_c0_g1_i1.p1  ORF type:complete len:249 (+),score=79.18 TRINITY_DN14929_c0_g1_i1:85-747(+)
MPAEGDRLQNLQLQLHAAALRYARLSAEIAELTQRGAPAEEQAPPGAEGGAHADEELATAMQGMSLLVQASAQPRDPLAAGARDPEPPCVDTDSEAVDFISQALDALAKAQPANPRKFLVDHCEGSFSQDISVEPSADDKTRYLKEQDVHAIIGDAVLALQKRGGDTIQACIQRHFTDPKALGEQARAAAPAAAETDGGPAQVPSGGEGSPTSDAGRPVG